MLPKAEAPPIEVADPPIIFAASSSLLSNSGLQICASSYQRNDLILAYHVEAPSLHGGDDIAQSSIAAFLSSLLLVGTREIY